MRLEVLKYKIYNWRTYWRSFWLGTINFNRRGVTYQGKLEAIIIQANGEELDLGTIGTRVVTNAGIEFMVDDFDAGGATTDITLFNFHDSGTGVAAEAVTDTDLGTPAGPTTRATGTKSQPIASQFRSVGTIAYTSTLAITEHGIFNQAARGAGSILWDRSVFAAINVVNGDSIQFTYTLTVNSGG